MNDIDEIDNNPDLNLTEIIDTDDTTFSDCNYLDLSSENFNEFSPFDTKIAHLNVHSIPNKYEDLKDLLNEMQQRNLLPHVLLLCETFFNDRNFDKFNFQNYDIISEYRKDKTKGGVSIMVRSNLKYIVRNDLKIFRECKFESVFIEISRKNNKNIIIGEVYRVPGTNESDFLNDYEQIVNKIKAEHKCIVIGTDQNLDYLKVNVHGNTRKFFELNLSNCLIPCITKPTRITHRTATLIDNIYVDAQLTSRVKSHIITSDISDHFLCLVIIPERNLTFNNPLQYRTRKINDTVLRNIRGMLMNKDWSYLDELTVDDASHELSTEISRALDWYAPVRYFKHKTTFQRREPWYTVGLQTSAVKCLKMYRKVLHKPKDCDEYVLYKEYRNRYNRLRRAAKIQYYNELISKNRNNSKKLWSTLHEITGKMKNKTEISEEFLINGIRERNGHVISNAFAKYYANIGRSLAERIESKGNINDPITGLIKRVDKNCFLFPTTRKEIEKYILSLKAKNSKGNDDVSNNILKSIYPSIIQALSIIFNKSLSCGQFPGNMKTAIIKPLYKGRSNVEIGNYRPVSLLPVISKVLEKIVNSRLIKFLTKNKVLFEGQYGFRRRRSTSDAILDLTGNILDGFNKGMFTLGLFLDMTKAFDSIKHETLFRKLEVYGVRGIALNWIKSYLTNRNIQVNYNGTISDKYSIDFGTPQGSVLGPLLYIILANDMPKCLKFCNSVIFADDTTIFVSGKNLKFLYRKLNEDLKRLSNWFNSNLLTLNAEKSNYILFRTKNKQIDYSGKVMIDGNEIRRVSSTKFLGVLLDEYLDWNLHVKTLLNKLAIGNYSLNMCKNMLKTHTKRLLYLSNIQSHINYALSSWGSMLTHSNLKKIQVMQNKAVRSLFNLNSRERMKPYYKKAKLLMLEDQIRLSLLNISFRYVNDILPNRIVNLFEVIRHGRQTRNQHNLTTPHHTLQIYNNSFLGRAPNYWLRLANDLKDKTNTRAFSKSFCRSVLEMYN